MNNAWSVLTAREPANSLEYVEEVAYEYYGLKAIASELACERDQLLMLEDTQGERYILRIINPVEPPEISDFQTRALLHIAETDPDLPVPRVVPALNGDAHITVSGEDGHTCAARLITCVPGSELSGLASPPPELYRDLGSKLARLDLALNDFSHPAAKHDLIWDLERADRIQDLLIYVRNDELREFAALALDAYKQNVMPLIPRLRRQIIHNDFNLTNIMVDGKNPGRVAGIIDFGDMIESPIINEAAISLYYQIDEAPDSFRHAGLLLASYHRTLPLEAVELDILYDLMLARGALSIAIADWRSAEFRKQGRYMFRNHTYRDTGLYRLTRLGREKVQEMLFTNCKY